MAARSRAYYRAQHQRARARAVRWLKQRGIPLERVYSYTSDRTPCSCDMCGNPRRHWGLLTVAELRDADGWKSEEADLPIER